MLLDWIWIHKILFVSSKTANFNYGSGQTAIVVFLLWNSKKPDVYLQVETFKYDDLHVLEQLLHDVEVSVKAYNAAVCKIKYAIMNVNFANAGRVRLIGCN